MTSASELESKLTSAERDRSFANVRPRDAATLIIVDRTSCEPKVLLGKRHHGHKFMPGKFVFPGGRAEPGDRRMTTLAPLHPLAEKALMQEVVRPSAVKARALALAAVRETFEETGLLLGAKRSDIPPGPEGPWRDFAARGVIADLSKLHFVARAITPPRHSRRFDTRFFSIDASEIADRIENVIHPEAELVELTWLPISEARKLDLATITSVVLQELEARVAAGFGHDLPVPFYRMPRRHFIRVLV